ncbi:MAG: hypothetical protein KJO69_08205 [Gammaproteobacteria bacterium]|nr:hypothetical protein [Gammaproteobacteria bacterium]
MKRTSIQERQAHISAWQVSGQSKKAYCELQGLNYGTFISWFKKVEEVGSDFIVLSPPGGVARMSIELPNGVCVHYSGELSLALLQILSHV